MFISEHVLKDSLESGKVLEEILEDVAVLVLLKVRPHVLEEPIVAMGEHNKYDEAATAW
jgi:hypothetical protein